jgi:hypothetical protein
MSMLLFGYYFHGFLSPKNSVRYKSLLLLLLAFWLYGGFVNPQIISSTGAVFFGFILALVLTPQKDDWVSVGPTYGAIAR